MTDRTRIITVALDKEYRTDDVKSIINAISMIKGVLAVEVEVLDSREWMALQTAKSELAEKLWEVIYPKENK